MLKNLLAEKNIQTDNQCQYIIVDRYYAKPRIMLPKRFCICRRINLIDCIFRDINLNSYQITQIHL